jgi:hypothetical protein
MFKNFTDDQFAAWLTGFTDGEGYIGVAPTARKNVSCVRIVIANTVEETIRAIQKRLGYGAVRSQKQRENWKRKYTWSVSSLQNSERFLIFVYNFLTIKKDAADRAFARIEEAKDNFRRRAERNAAIIAAAKSGEYKKDIGARYGLSPQCISMICEGHKWPSEASRVAKVRRRDERGLFVAVEK